MKKVVMAVSAALLMVSASFGDAATGKITKVAVLGNGTVHIRGNFNVNVIISIDVSNPNNKQLCAAAMTAYLNEKDVEIVYTPTSNGWGRIENTTGNYINMINK